jgi:hypothetical protein
MLSLDKILNPKDPYSLPDDLDELWNLYEQSTSEMQRQAQRLQEQLEWLYPDDSYKRREAALAFKKAASSNPYRKALISKIRFLSGYCPNCNLKPCGCVCDVCGQPVPGNHSACVENRTAEINRSNRPVTKDPE